MTTWAILLKILIYLSLFYNFLSFIIIAPSPPSFLEAAGYQYINNFTKSQKDTKEAKEYEAKFLDICFLLCNYKIL